MGVILAKFRKEKTTTAILEGLEEKIQQIEKYSFNTQAQKKKFVGNFLAIAIGVYVIAFIVFYFVYFPPTWQERIIYSVPLFLFPIVIIFLRKLFTWYFQRKLNKNSAKLSDLRAEKEKILNQVMEKETYKVAVGLLTRFGDKSSTKTFFSTPRSTSSNTKTPLNQSLKTYSSTTNNRLNQSLHLQPAQPQSIQRSLNSSISATPRSLAVTPQMSTNVKPYQELRRRTPFPIINQQEKGVFERIMDGLVGDGPNDRFAMICKECFGHNGMALKEEFDYTTFRCAFCNVINYSRKERPVAPRLPIQQNISRHLQEKHDSDSTSVSSRDDSDDETSPLTWIKAPIETSSTLEMVNGVDSSSVQAVRTETTAETEAKNTSEAKPEAATLVDKKSTEEETTSATEQHEL